MVQAREFPPNGGQHWKPQAGHQGDGAQELQVIRWLAESRTLSQGLPALRNYRKGKLAAVASYLAAGVLQSFSSVVGPNGSGKSNVIDAMLFVFGKRAKQASIRCNLPKGLLEFLLP